MEDHERQTIVQVHSTGLPTGTLLLQTSCGLKLRVRPHLVVRNLASGRVILEVPAVISAIAQATPSRYVHTMLLAPELERLIGAVLVGAVGDLLRLELAPSDYQQRYPDGRHAAGDGELADVEDLGRAIRPRNAADHLAAAHTLRSIHRQLNKLQD